MRHLLWRFCNMAFTINRRYNVRQEISGDGASSRVLLVDDVLRGQRACALKLLRPMGERDLTGARREFETLRSLRHPLIAEVYDFGRVEEVEGNLPDDGDARGIARPGDLFITFSYVDGLDLRAAYLRLFPPALESRSHVEVDVQETKSRWRIFYEALAEIALGLHAIHSRGLVHHDIKPQNLLLVPRGSGPIPERFDVKIIDLDLAEPETTPLGFRLRGTLPFVAPEVLSGAFADRRSDLYSLGVSITWAISGRTPFSAQSTEELAQAIKEGVLIDLAELCPGAPAPFREVIARLVRHRSEERIPDALALVAELERIGGFTHLGRARSFRAEVPAVGWERELAVLSGEIEALAMGESERSLALVETDPGQFTDHFIQEVEAAASLWGVKCITGRARVPALFPYQPLSEIIQKLLPHLDLESPRYERFREALLGGGVGPPSFRPGSGKPSGSAEGREAAKEKLKFFDGVTEFLLQAGREAPFVLVVRDLGRCDGDTLDLLKFLARNIALRLKRDEDQALLGPEGEGGEPAEHVPIEEPSRLLIIADYEGPLPSGPPYPGEDAPPGDHPPASRRVAELGSEPHALSVKLKPLGQERIAEWIARRSPGLSPAVKLIQKIHERCAGAPRLLDEIVRRLPQASSANQEEGEIEAVLGLPDNLQDACLERLSRFGSADRLLLDLLAVAQVPLAIPVLGKLEERLLVQGPGSLSRGTGGGEAEASARIRRLVDEGFLMVVEGPEGLLAGWTVESLREQVYRQLPEEKSTEYHRAILDELAVASGSARAGALTEDLAFHARKGGRPAQFFHFVLQAAEGYRRAHAAEPAIRLLEEALEFLGNASPRAEDLPGEMSREALRWSINWELGELYRQDKRCSRALEKYTVLLSLEGGGRPDLLSRSEIYRKMGEVYCENRDPANALFFLEKSLELLSEGPPSREQVETLRALAQFHLGRGQFQRAESAAQRALDALERLEAPELRLEAYSLLGAIASKQNDHARSLAMNQKALEELEGGEDPERAADIAGAIGENYKERGDYKKAIEHFNRAIELAQRAGSKHALALFYNQLGTIHFNRANHYQALDFFRQALRLRQELGDQKGIANTYNNLGLVFRVRDDLTRATECYKKSIEIFTRIDDQYGMATGMNNLANILELEGRYNEALDYCFRSLEKRKRFNSKTGVAYSYYRIGKIFQSKGELDKARSFAEKSLGIRREIGEKMGIAYSHVQLAELCLLSGKLFDAFQECQRGQKEFEQLENDLGRLFAREILARILTRVGILDEAAETLHEILARAREGNQQYFVGLALLDLGRLGIEERQLREAEAHLSRAESLFRENRNRREHAEALLERCLLTLELGQHQRASEVLEDAYGTLEELGIRDLVPRYFLLRGRIESESPDGSTERARKFLERGLVEARQVNLPDLSWQLHYRLAILFSHQGEQALARGQVREGEAILDAQFEPLPLRFQERFYLIRDRAELKKLKAALEDGQPVATPEPGGLPATAGPTSPADLGQIEEIRSLNKRLFNLQEVSRAITSELDLRKLLEKLMDAVLELVNAERGFLILRSPTGGTDSITVARNLDREMVEKPELKISHSISAEVIRTGRPVLSTSALDDERFVGSKSVQNLRLLSILCLPLLSREGTLGAIYLDNRLRRHAFSEDDLRVLETFSAQAAVAITNARLSEEIQSRNRELVEANRQMDVLNQRLLKQVNERTAELKAVREHLRQRPTEVQARTRYHKLVGKSKRVQEIFHILDRISSTALPVLIQGESGTGKELIANAIHQTSTRRDQRFISENCAALSETLLESELFGHTRGAFTGAAAERKGLFELAHGGTLFLDEVCDMSLGMQVKLLRVLQEGEIRRVGGKDTIKVDTRILSASNQDLKALVDAGKFREDLFYRLNGIRIDLPSLRERKEDIPLLTQHFLEEIAHESRQPVKSITPEALRLLLSYDWPGNVRELRHFLERTVLLATGTVIEERDCLFDPVIFRRESLAISDGLLLDLEKLPLRAARDGFLKHYLERLFEDHGQNVSRAARACGISRESFHRLLKKFKIGR